MQANYKKFCTAIKNNIMIRDVKLIGIIYLLSILFRARSPHKTIFVQSCKREKMLRHEIAIGTKWVRGMLEKIK